MDEEASFWRKLDIEIQTRKSLFYVNPKRAIATNYRRKNIKDVGDIYALFKESFKDILQELLEAEQGRHCVSHMLRNSFKYVSYKDLRQFAADFKAVYKAPTEDLALSELEALKDTWGNKYPYAISNWQQNWEEVRPFFQFGDDIRRIIYTTNIIEGVNRYFRKTIKTKSVFPNDVSLEKMLYLTTQNIQRK